MKAAIYCRLSEEDRNKRNEQDDSNSIANQKAMLTEYALDKGWDIYGIYSDDDFTGADRKRPQFNQLLRDAEARQFDIVLCKTQSRFTRELELVEKYIHGLFPKWGIRFVSIVDNADTENKGNKKSRQINGLVNEWYLEDMSENIKSVLTSRRKNGFHIGAFALYGYRKDPDRPGRLLIDEEAAVVVRQVFSLFAQGYGKTAIARMLNDRCIPNPTEYKRLHGLRYKSPNQKNSTLWRYPAIADMLANEIYIGNMVQGKYGSVSYKTKQNKPRPKSEWYIVEGTHEPIIDRVLWDRVQALIAERAKPFASGTVGLFARRVKCMNCGYAMRSTKNRGLHYLQCSNRHVSESACVGAFISVATLEKVIISEINRISEECLDADEVCQRIDIFRNLKEKRSRLQQEIATYQKKIEEDTTGLRILYLDKVKGLITESDFVALSREFSEERERLTRMVADVETQLLEIEAEVSGGDQRRDIVARYTRLEQLDREMIVTFIDHVAIGKRKKGEKYPPIEVHWNF